LIIIAELIILGLVLWFPLWFYFLLKLKKLCRKEKSPIKFKNAGN
jgi:hypothetical protein